MITYSNFRINSGREVKDGKINYPDYINIKFDKKIMFQVLSQIARALESGNDEILVMLAGKLEEDDQ